MRTMQNTHKHSSSTSSSFTYVGKVINGAADWCWLVGGSPRFLYDVTVSSFGRSFDTRWPGGLRLSLLYAATVSSVGMFNGNFRLNIITSFKSVSITFHDLAKIGNLPSQQGTVQILEYSHSQPSALCSRPAYVNYFFCPPDRPPTIEEALLLYETALDLDLPWSPLLSRTYHLPTWVRKGLNKLVHSINGLPET
jgi:hypothetical protein